MEIDGATIEVINWEKYNPRTDTKRPTWFRFENTLATGPAFFDLDCEQKWLWVFILSLISEKNGQPIIWNSGYCTSQTKISKTKQIETIEIFEKFVRLRVSRKVTSRDSYPTNERTNERTECQPELSLSANALPRLGQIWNDHCGQLPKIKACNSTRKKQAELRWKEKSDEQYWIEVIRRILASKFCTGNNERQWTASFDWLLQPETQNKVLEGKYDNRGHKMDDKKTLEEVLRETHG